VKWGRWCRRWGRGGKGVSRVDTGRSRVRWGLQVGELKQLAILGDSAPVARTKLCSDTLLLEGVVLPKTVRGHPAGRRWASQPVKRIARQPIDGLARDVPSPLEESAVVVKVIEQVCAQRSQLSAVEHNAGHNSHVHSSRDLEVGALVAKKISRTGL
jgi:hypothetical protein